MSFWERFLDSEPSGVKFKQVLFEALDSNHREKVHFRASFMVEDTEIDLVSLSNFINSREGLHPSTTIQNFTDIRLSTLEELIESFSIIQQNLEILAKEFEVDNVLELGYVVISFSVGTFSEISFILAPFFDEEDKNEFFSQELTKLKSVILNPTLRLQSHEGNAGTDEPNLISQNSRILKFLKSGIPASKLSIFTHISNDPEAFKLNLTMCKMVTELRREFKMSQANNHPVVIKKKQLTNGKCINNLLGNSNLKAMDCDSENLFSTIQNFIKTILPPDSEQNEEHIKGSPSTLKLYLDKIEEFEGRLKAAQIHSKNDSGQKKLMRVWNRLQEAKMGIQVIQFIVENFRTFIPNFE